MRVISQLYALLKDPESSLDDAIELIKSDGVLAAGVVRLSNSVYYGHHQGELDLQSAVQQVGFQETLRLVGGLLSRQLFMRDLTGYGLTADEYWTYSYYCAAFMEQVARSIRMNPDNAYLAGLLHGIGRVVNNELLLHEEVEILWDPTLPSEKWEQIMGLDPYTRVGATVLKSWGFPVAICDLVATQRDPEALTTSAPVRMLDFARALAEFNRPAIGRARQNWEMLPGHPIHASGLIDAESLQSFHQKALERVSRLQRAL
jgi:HD-like signal output (HDOD) protein